MNNITRAALFAAIILSAAACSQTASKSNAAANTADVTPSVSVASVEKRSVEQFSSYSSTVEAYAVNNIAPQSASRIRKINVEVGDYVNKGQVLAEMDRLSLDQARLQLVNDSTELGRLRTLYAEGGVAKSDLEAAELAYNVRLSSYRNLEENTILRAPISGYVTARNYDRNDLYSMSQPLFVVQQVLPVKLLVGVSESEYTKVKKGDNVNITLDAIPGRTFTGKVERLYPTIDAATHTFRVEVVVPNSDRVLRPGMYAKVLITFGTNDNVVIPDQAVVRMEGTGQKYVYTLNADQTVSFVPVTLGRHMGSEYEVTSGLSGGEQVVVKGQTTLKDGVTVQVIR
ncbi:MAG: efflux RND transporter periplasmic adaptor subunit [Bacteroidales bacterium]|nr:efflux RND transporter periplasmic adaptor subunit [Bacteroidales bacterium]